MTPVVTLTDDHEISIHHNSINPTQMQEVVIKEYVIDIPIEQSRYIWCKASELITSPRIMVVVDIVFLSSQCFFFPKNVAMIESQAIGHAFLTHQTM